MMLLISYQIDFWKVVAFSGWGDTKKNNNKHKISYVPAKI